MLIMSVFIPSNLNVSFEAPTTPFRPVLGRKYTLTHSDTTGKLFLSIGCEYNYGAINQIMRDEVLAEWVTQMGESSLLGKVHVSSGEFDEKYAMVRFFIFQKELELALKAMMIGDQIFFVNFPWLLDSPIYIQFQSNFPQYHQLLYMGTPRQYILAANNKIVS